MGFWGKLSNLLLKTGKSPAEQKVKETLIDDWYAMLTSDERDIFLNKDLFENGFRDIPLRKVELTSQIYRNEKSGKTRKEALSASDQKLVENAYLSGYHQAKETWKWSEDDACKRGDQIAWFALHVYRYC